MTSRLRHLGIGLAITTILAAMGAASAMHGSGVDLRDRMARYVAEVEERAAAQVSVREPVWGEAVDGRAFDRYAQAAAALRGLTMFAWHSTERCAYLGGKPVGAEQFAELRRRLAPGLELLGEGARCRDNGQTRGEIGLSSGVAVNAIMPEVAARLAEGRAVEAVRLWLEGITFLADCRDHFYLAHWSLGSQLVFGDEDLGAMSGLARELLAVGLSRLERQLMMPRTLDDMLAPVVANTLQGRDGDGRSAAIPAGLGACAGAWGHGFDPLARHLEGLDELRRLGESLQLSATDEATWLRRWQAFCAAGRCGESNIAKHVDHWFQTYERCRRNALAKVRLLRLALAFHQGRELPSLLDPHTAAPFVQRIGGDDAVFRGSDPDGGEWLAHRTGR